MDLNPNGSKKILIQKILIPMDLTNHHPENMNPITFWLIAPIRMECLECESIVLSWPIRLRYFEYRNLIGQERTIDSHSRHSILLTSSEWNVWNMTQEGVSVDTLTPSWVTFRCLWIKIHWDWFYKKLLRLKLFYKKLLRLKFFYKNRIREPDPVDPIDFFL